MRPALTALLLVLLTACAPTVVRPPGQPLPSTGEPVVGTSYRLTLYCPRPIEVGDSIWLFDRHESWPQREPVGLIDSIWGSVGDPYPVHGIVTIESSREAVFRADVNGRELELVRGGPDDLGDACL